MTTPTTTGRPSEAASDPTFDIAALAGRLGRDQVFGPPTERGGTTLVPVARVAAGGGAGRGPGEPAAGDSGGGAGVLARPVGAFSVDSEGKVRWHPAVDVTRIVLGGQLVIAVVLATALRRRRRRRRGAA